jgi:DNA-binding PadR family transcriptional regulator
MSVKQGLLALLVEGPRYGAELKSEFEQRTGTTWPLNIGQVYTTLARLQRDGLVEPAGEDEQRRLRYRVTDDGRAAVTAWFVSPVQPSTPARDELAIKLALAVTVPGVDVRELIQTQRAATLRTLQGYTRLKREPAANGDLAWTLVLESLLFSAEAEIRWLDHCEARVARAAAERPAGPAPVAVEAQQAQR